MDNNTPNKRPSIVEVLSTSPKKKKAISPSEVLTTEVRPNVVPQAPPKEIIKERVVVQYRDRERGCLPNVGCGCGCRTISCSFFLIIFLIIAGIAYVVINKPPFIWGEVVTILNDGVKAPKYEPQDLDTLQSSINSQISSIGEVEILLTQDQVTTLIRDNATQLKDITVEVSKDKLTLYWYLDQTLPSKPLYGIVDISGKNDDTLQITRIGTGKVALPDFINQTATNGIYSLLNISTDNPEQNPLSILTSLFNSQNINVKSVELEEGIVKITADINVNLFQ